MGSVLQHLRRTMMRITRFHCYPKLFNLLLLLLIGMTTLYMFTFYRSTMKTIPSSKISKPEGLRMKGKVFTIDKKPFRIMSGSMHYFRVPVQSWEDRLLKLKAMGLNTVDIYVPWNVHEPGPGIFDFQDNLNLKHFLHLVDVYDLYAIIRPGPYICSEWDLGGLPSWLLADKGMILRSRYKPFLQAVDRYFEKLMPILRQFQYSYGGPVIAFQIENEYGSYGNDELYMQYLKSAFEKHGLQELFFVCDNGEGLGKYKLDGVLQTVNFMAKDASKLLDRLQEMQPDLPLFVTELWDGWFDHWKEKHHVVNASKIGQVLASVLDRGGSFNLYMWHGGTNFGFMNGANAKDDGSDYCADVTSYDYDAPVSETGLIREKYHVFRDILKAHAPDAFPANLPWVSTEHSFTMYDAVRMTHFATLNDIIKSRPEEVIMSKFPVNMEELPINNGAGQSYGYIVYQREIPGDSRVLTVFAVNDYVKIFVNGKSVLSEFAPREAIKINIDGHVEASRKNLLQIVVENCGRVNYGMDLDRQRKGILRGVSLNELPLEDWEIFPLEFKTNWVIEYSKSGQWQPFDGTAESLRSGVPTLYTGNMFVHAAPRDTLLDIKGWSKGVVFLNGHNLGRYWHVGPQRTLYVPAPWMRRGNNTIVVFDLDGEPTMAVGNEEKKFLQMECAFDHDLGEKDQVEFLI